MCKRFDFFREHNIYFLEYMQSFNPYCRPEVLEEISWVGRRGYLCRYITDLGWSSFDVRREKSLKMGADNSN